jgi:phospholipase C
MTVASTRRLLKVEGRSASIRELVKQRNEIPFQPNVKFPVSLRKFIGALPPGRIGRKVIPLKFLQSKLDEFINTPKLPPLQIRLHGSHFGVSTLFVFKKDKIKNDYDRKNPLVERELAGPGETLNFSVPFRGTHNFRFNDVNSNSLKVNIVSGQPAGIEIVVRFETEGGENGEEIRVEGFSDIDFDGFNITVKMEFGSSRGAVDLLSWVDEINLAAENGKTTPVGGLSTALVVETKFRGKTFTSVRTTVEEAKDDLKHQLAREFITVNVSVNVGNLVPDGTVADKIKSKLTNKIFDALKDNKNREALRQKFNPFLLGGDFHVTRVSNDDKDLTIEFLVPLDQLEPFPEHPQAPLDSGLMANIDHIVVLMMENRSFDHMLGYLSKDGGRADVDGLGNGQKNTFRGSDFKPFPLTDTVFEKGPCHEHECVVNQVAGNMGGFVADYAHHREDEGGKPRDVMGHYTAKQVPVYDFLAKEFLICQRWFASHPGPTFPNRFYTLTGRLNRDGDGRFEFDNPHGADFRPVFTRTIFDHLTEHGVTWHYYEQGYCFLRLFDRYTVDDQLIVQFRDPKKGFFAAAREGKLPSVSFIDPDFIDVPPGNDDGPPADIAFGQHLVAEVVKAVMTGPSWNKTLLVITYDEHGGFFDHVPPPAAIPVSAINEYGVRVPAFVISPWVDRGKVSNTLFDHTSIAKTIARRFMSAKPPDMGERMAGANDLSEVLRETPRTDKPNIQVPPEPARKPAVAAKQNGENGQDFKGILQAVRAQRRDSKV